MRGVEWGVRRDERSRVGSEEINEIIKEYSGRTE